MLAKVVLWVLLGTAPIFISCMFFNATRSYAIGWINQCLLYAMIPLFIYVIAAFLIAAMEPELTKIDQISGNRELKLSDFAAFIMLCIAGAFVLFQVQSLAQGIAGGHRHGDWTTSHAGAPTRAIFWSREAISQSARQTQAAVHRVQARLRPSAARRLRRRCHAAVISANGTPR